MSRNLSRPIRQACAVPYRVRRGKLEFCLITSTRKGRWAFPKGIVDPGETLAETALKEAREEAGLLGEIEGRPLGKYRYAKWGTKLAVTAFLMRVRRTEQRWLEADVRERRWCGVKEAQERIVRQELQKLLESALTRLAQLGKSKHHSKPVSELT